jgi:hypothetical protein
LITSRLNNAVIIRTQPELLSKYLFNKRNQ